MSLESALGEVVVELIKKVVESRKKGKQLEEKGKDDER